MRQSAGCSSIASRPPSTGHLPHRPPPARLCSGILLRIPTSAVPFRPNVSLRRQILAPLVRRPGDASLLLRDKPTRKGANQESRSGPAAPASAVAGQSSTTTIDYAAAARMGASQPNKEDEGKTMTVEKKMKKKIFRVPQDRLDYYLSFKASPVRQSQALRDPSAAAELDKIMEQIQAEQENMRREYEAKGYATFEADVTDDDEEEEDAAAGAIAPCITPQGDNDLAAPWFIPHRGRRRFRPGVVKQAGGVKKVII